MPKEKDLVNGAQRYESATLRAFWEEIVGWLLHKETGLLNFNDVRECLRLWQERDHGLQDIPVNRIVGSVGRPNDFTGKFRPKSAVDRDRWSRVFAETVGDAGLPPIEVYQVGDNYYVRDGNHRVSVARDMGFKTIEARVTEVMGIEPAPNELCSCEC
jgi:hypothetical protein